MTLCMNNLLRYEEEDTLWIHNRYRDNTGTFDLGCGRGTGGGSVETDGIGYGESFGSGGRDWTDTPNTDGFG